LKPLRGIKGFASPNKGFAQHRFRRKCDQGWQNEQVEKGRGKRGFVPELIRLWRLCGKKNLQCFGSFPDLESKCRSPELNHTKKAYLKACFIVFQVERLIFAGKGF
jgi:hypothetical protein